MTIQKRVLMVLISFNNRKNKLTSFLSHIHRDKEQKGIEDGKVSKIISRCSIPLVILNKQQSTNHLRSMFTNKYSYHILSKQQESVYTDISFWNKENEEKKCYGKNLLLLFEIECLLSLIVAVNVCQKGWNVVRKVNNGILISCHVHTLLYSTPTTCVRVPIKKVQQKLTAY
ncbi:CLUMA_CG018316, isoform A [Clunio marinus]|uniref:CLUMA_CG018316, isoform A n=1 Tax=Clunio marinus TaxID=568069 RepID=A0A1J1IYX8_9DIPT|nr:CLUMA_CG018316, isoform A [Clunio marinus]